jgi:hypothetical protein
MQAYCLSTLDELTPYAEDWDRLAGGVPYRGWAWLSTWWKNYGPSNYRQPQCDHLAVVCVFDNHDTLVGVAPWYLHHGVSKGRVLRQMGDGEVCSDYLGLLCRPDMQDQVAESVAHWLVENEGAGDGPFELADPLPWDLLELTGIDFQDQSIRRLLWHLDERRKMVHHRRGPNCWRVDLPPTWEEYLSMISKNHRKRLRRLQRNAVDSGRAVLRTVECFEDLQKGIEILVDLHQRRRRAVGEPGCFASKSFNDFHREVMPLLLSNGQLQLQWLELDGKPVAIEYDLAGGGVVYAYQSGIDPDASKENPGTLLTLLTLRRAIEQGFRAVDFLRGNEPYKLHWKAAPRPQIDTHVVANRTASRLRHGLWMAGSNVKQWMKGGNQWAT